MTLSPYDLMTLSPSLTLFWLRSWYPYILAGGAKVPNSCNMCPNDQRLRMKLHLPKSFSKISYGVCHCPNFADISTYFWHQPIFEKIDISKILAPF